MSDVSVSQLVGCLKGWTLHNRTGILLVSPSWLGREAEIATRLAISFEDEREWVLRQLAPGQQYLEQNWNYLIRYNMQRWISLGSIQKSNYGQLFC